MDTEIKKQLVQTGGGPPPNAKTHLLNEMVHTIVPIDLEIANNWDRTGRVTIALFNINSTL